MPQRIAVSLIVLALALEAFARSTTVYASHTESSTNPREAIAKAVANAQADLYNQCPNGRVTDVYVYTSQQISGDYTVATAQAHGTCENTDNSAQSAVQAQQDKANTEAGAAVGQAMGGVFVAMAQRHAFNKMVKKYCKEHRGETWTYRQPFADGSPNPDGAILHTGTCKK